MLILIRCHDNERQEIQMADSEKIAAVVFVVSMVCYMDRKPLFRILRGSI